MNRVIASPGDMLYLFRLKGMQRVPRTEYGQAWNSFERNIVARDAATAIEALQQYYGNSEFRDISAHPTEPVDLVTLTVAALEDPE